MRAALAAGSLALAASGAWAQEDPHAAHRAPASAHADHDAMRSPLGPYAMSRDASGSAWQPEASPMVGIHAAYGNWTVMTHGLVNAVYSDQGGRRGGDKAFVSGMLMGMAQRPLGAGTLGLRAALAPDPLMGRRGYPLLFAAGETADGLTPLVDRQHPHDLFMELSASWSLPLSADSSVFVYAGLPGEPAFGPPSFMHRPSSLDSPEAPLSHHWLDSTHITFGVVTAGYVNGPWKAEASAFRGREPDDSRYDIETGALDSAAARISFNPGPNWSLQASWARINSPEALEAHHDENRASVSAAYAGRVGAEGRWAATAAVARKDVTPGDVLWAVLAEGSMSPNGDWTFFGRAERVEQNELDGGHGPAHPVGKLSVGVIRDFRLAEEVRLGVGGLVSAFVVPGALKPLYGDPSAGMAFVRLKIG